MTSRDYGTSAPSLGAVERWAALAAGSALAIYGVNRRSASGAWLIAASAPLLYRSVTGRWPPPLNRLAGSDDTRAALGGNRGIHVFDAIRLELPVHEVYAYWRQLENLPRFMTHLDRVQESGGGRSHWVAIGPAGARVEWDAEIINEVDNEILAWRSLPGADLVSAGSVTFEPARGERSTQVTVHLQYSPPAGKAGALFASLFGREPSQAIREDLRRFKQLLEAGEVPRAEATPGQSGSRGRRASRREEVLR